MIYLDGSALCRFLPGVRHYEAFGAWARDHIDELVTTQLGFTELRQAAELYPRSAAERVAGIVDLVRAGVAVIRFSDDNVAISSHATSVLKPFAALHVGAAVADAQVDTIVTYDPALANVARIYNLTVKSPGLPEGWYLAYEGPPEHWKPVALDAPYDPGAEFDVPEVAPRRDAYEVALEEAQREAAAKAGLEEAAAEAALEEAAAEASSTDDGEAADSAEDPEQISELERAIREAEAAAIAEGAGGGDEFDDEFDDEREQGAGAHGYDGAQDHGAVAAEPGGTAASAAAPRIGTYRPRIEAWHEGDAEEDRPRLEDSGESETADDVTHSDDGAGAERGTPAPDAPGHRRDRLVPGTVRRTGHHQPAGRADPGLPPRPAHGPRDVAGPRASR